MLFTFDCAILLAAMGCGASAACKNESVDNDVKPIQGATIDEIVQGKPVSTETEDITRKLRIIEGLCDAATAILDSNPSASAGLGIAAASVADRLPPSAKESDPKVAAALAKVDTVVVDSTSIAQGTTLTAASSAKKSAQA